MNQAAAIEQYLAGLSVSPRTREAYQGDLRRFGAWCNHRGVDVFTVDAASIFQFQAERRKAGAKDSSINRQLTTVLRFLRWLCDTGERVSAPTVSLLPEQRRIVRDTLTVEQLRSMWRAAISPCDRAVVSLLGIQALRVDELCGADVTDLTLMDGFRVLRLPPRAENHSYPLTVLSTEVAAAIDHHLAGRRAGALVVRNDGSRMTRRSAARIVARLGKHADIPFRVSPLTLTFTLRAVAIQRGFTYASVVRAAGEFEARRLAKWVASAPNPISDHAALRLSKLVMEGSNPTLDHLGEAEVMLRESDAHPAASVMLAAASLEGHLRNLTASKNIPMDRAPEKANLKSYLSRLRSANVIDDETHHIGNVIALRRDDAAHGWFDQISRDDAEWVVDHARAIAERFSVT